jgi:hypothetical protein
MVTKKQLNSVAPVVPLPYAPENKFLSKADFVAKERKRKEIEAKTKAFAKELEGETEVDEPTPVVPAPSQEVPEVKKPVKKYKKTV